MVKKTLLKALAAGIIFGCITKIVKDGMHDEEDLCFDDEYLDKDENAGYECEGAGENRTAPAEGTEMNPVPPLQDAPAKTISLPPTMEKIGAYAFYDNDNIDYMELPEGLKVLGCHAFEHCKNMKRVKFPGGLKSIGSYAFYGTGVTEIVIPDSVEYLGEYVFAFCRDLRKASMPERFTDLPEGTFRGCQNLEEVVFTK